MGIVQTADALQRLKRPEFEWLMHMAETRFGPLLPDKGPHVRAQSNSARIRIVLGRKASAQRFSLSIGTGNFDYLMFGLAGREEVWIVPRKEFDSEIWHSVFIEDATDNNNTWNRARLSIGKRQIKLKSFLLFPTADLLKKQIAEGVKAERQAVSVALKAKRKQSTQLIAAEKQRSEGLARIKADTDFANLLQKVSSKVGALTPINKCDWALVNGATVHFSMSKPYRGTNDRAFIYITHRITNSDWLAVGVRGSEASWLIPMHIVRQFLSSKPTGGKTNSHIPFLGFRGEQDCLWLASDSQDIFLPIDEFKLYSTVPNRTSPNIRKAKRDRERIVRKANEVRTKIEKRLAESEDDMAMYNALAARFGKLDLTSTKPFRCSTNTNEVIFFGTYAHWLTYVTRALVTITPKWLESQWIAIAVKGQSTGWLIPTEILKSMLSDFPSKERRGKIISSVFIGPRKGRDRIWLGSDFKNGAVIDISEFRITIQSTDIDNRT